MPTRTSLILAALTATSAPAAPTIAPQFGQHAVIQRNRPIILAGTAEAGSHLLVHFAGQEQQSTADPAGDWRAQFPPREAGGPFTIEVSDKDGRATADDVMVGDVWLCSGQSNMEYPLRRALGYWAPEAEADASLRLAKVPHMLAATAQTRFEQSWGWEPSGPTIRDFSAACYFMVHELRASEKIPIGAIDVTWGGTPIRSWMDENALAISGSEDSVRVAALYQQDPTAGTRQFGRLWASWWRSKTAEATGREPWNDSSTLAWEPVPSLEYWDHWGAQWKGWVGDAWMRDRVTLSAAEVAQPATLSLSAVDDMDETFVNGTPVGGMNDPSTPRTYAIPKGVLKAGQNEIMVFIRNTWGLGGFVGPASQFALKFTGSPPRSLVAGWQYSRIPDFVGVPPMSPSNGSSGVAGIHHAMIAPFGPFAVKGVAWYQGESDLGQTGYDRRLAAWMASLRAQFRDSSLPFLIVSLAGWGRPVAHPVESDWASLVNEQRIASEQDSRSALISAVDLGDPDEIHPSNKQEVGHRLAQAARQLVYQDGGSAGPNPIQADRRNGSIIVSFSKPLQSLSGSNANAFELCAGAAASCRYAEARVEGNTIVLVSDSRPVTRVRYAWSDFPLVNLYDLDMLPVPVFEIPVR